MFDSMSDEEVRFFNELMPYSQWEAIEKAAFYAKRGNERKAERYRCDAGYSRGDMRDFYGRA